MEELIRFGVWGTGTISQQLAADIPLAEGAVLHAVASRTLDRARAFALAYKAPKAYQGLDALLADDEVDVVYIASPNHLHASDSIQCIEAGKAVLCEKPFAVSEAEARRITEAARAHNVFCMEAMWTRFIPAIRETKRLVDTGALGKVSLLQGNFMIALADESGSRFAAPESGGGALLDLGVYLISLAHYLLGEPESAQGLATLAASGADITSTIQLGWKTGALADLSVSLKLHGTDDARIIGDRGQLRIAEPFYRPHRLELKRYAAVEAAQPATIHSHENIARPRPPAAMLLRRRLSPALAYLRRGKTHHAMFSGNGYQYQLSEVVRCLRAGLTESSIMSLADSLSVMRTMDTVRSSWTKKL